MLDAKDFVFIKYDAPYKDYWFKVTGDSKEELTRRYMEQSMVEVSEVVYSQKEMKLGVKRIFPWNYDVIIPDDEELERVVVKAVIAHQMVQHLGI